MSRTKLGILNEQKAILTAAVDTLIDAKASIDQAIEKLVEDIEKVRIDIGAEMISIDCQLRHDLLHMQLEESE